MAKITIDGKDYDTDNLNEDAKANLASLQFTQSELQRTQAHLAILKTAEAAYAKALNKELNS
tara:strand:+ start:1281 stop:1466 length:186 start_codon:yes stop_codon:yes gene_type:complete